MYKIAFPTVLAVGLFLYVVPSALATEQSEDQLKVGAEQRGLEHVPPVIRPSTVPQGTQTIVGNPLESPTGEGEPSGKPNPEEQAKKMLEDEEWIKNWKEFNEKLDELENILKEYGLDVAGWRIEVNMHGEPYLLNPATGETLDEAPKVPENSDPDKWGEKEKIL